MPHLHALLLDDPQQHATLGVTGCAYCRQPKKEGSCFARTAERRSELTDRPLLANAMLQQGLDAANSDSGTRLEMRNAKEKLRHSGLPLVSWPPRMSAVWELPEGTAGTWTSAYMRLHNRDLCMHRDIISLALRLVQHMTCSGPQSRRQWDTMLSRMNEYWRGNFRDWSIMEGNEVQARVLRHHQEELCGSEGVAQKQVKHPAGCPRHSGVPRG